MPINNKVDMIKVTGLSKQFKLPHERHNSLKSTLLNFNKRSFETFTALDDINFTVKKGEFFGIVGRNGSGKSTLLKLLAGIYAPTLGKVDVRGKLTPFIELGVGFNPELTGRENVFLNGAILGLSQKEVEDRYDKIVEFSELEKFMDQKLKNYSSGMQVRLAFSISIQAHNEILLIDEVLAVGDANFQRKCYQVFKDIKKQGKTVVFVTHDMGAVQDFCDRAMMIEDSKIVIIGKPREVAVRYEVANSVQANTVVDKKVMKSVRPENAPVKIDRISFVDSEDVKKPLRIKQGDAFRIKIDYTVIEPTEIQFNLFLTNQEGRYLCGINTTEALFEFKPSKGKHSLYCHYAPGQLPKGEFTPGAAIYTYLKYPSVERATLLDVFDSAYGVPLPILKIIDDPTYQSGQFNVSAAWVE